MEYADGTRYIGAWRHDRKHGQGTLEWITRAASPRRSSPKGRFQLAGVSALADARTTQENGDIATPVDTVVVAATSKGC
ncbi:hypothetical protein T484DRAFT_1810607 [Baffinella frigidus]|nr:hypothetical protein T484DRAFT_1810607 [Cryptophyta sp. CCMP2293]